MTRSVEIPEETVEKAHAAWLAKITEHGLPRDAVRAALAAALPYLVPAAPDDCSDPEFHPGQCKCLPAGDGGLRHDLEQLADLYEAEGKQADDGVSHHRIVGGLRRLLAARPAAPAVPQPADPVADWTRLDECAAASAQMIQWHAPETAAALVDAAVPQPVDREALESILADELANWLDHPPTERWNIAKALTGSVLAVLAGEQEQAEP